MTSKTFKSEVSHGRLSISDTRNGLFTVAVRRSGESVDMIDLKTETAPALALAILEAAGESPLGEARWVNDAKYALGEIAIFRSNKEADAKEQAELEAEALELFKTLMGVKGYENFTWSEVASKDDWLAVARKAREIGAKK